MVLIWLIANIYLVRTCFFKECMELKNIINYHFYRLLTCYLLTNPKGLEIVWYVNYIGLVN